MLWLFCCACVHRPHGHRYVLIHVQQCIWVEHDVIVGGGDGG